MQLINVLKEAEKFNMEVNFFDEKPYITLHDDLSTDNWLFKNYIFNTVDISRRNYEVINTSMPNTFIEIHFDDNIFYDIQKKQVPEKIQGFFNKPGLLEMDKSILQTAIKTKNNVVITNYKIMKTITDKIILKLDASVTITLDKYFNFFPRKNEDEFITDVLLISPMELKPYILDAKYLKNIKDLHSNTKVDSILTNWLGIKKKILNRYFPGEAIFVDITRVQIHVLSELLINFLLAGYVPKKLNFRNKFKPSDTIFTEDFFNNYMDINKINGDIEKDKSISTLTILNSNFFKGNINPNDSYGFDLYINKNNSSDSVLTKQPLFFFNFLNKSNLSKKINFRNRYITKKMFKNKIYIDNNKNIVFNEDLIKKIYTDNILSLKEQFEKILNRAQRLFHFDEKSYKNKLLASLYIRKKVVEPFNMSATLSNIDSSEVYKPLAIFNAVFGDVVNISSFYKEDPLSLFFKTCKLPYIEFFTYDLHSDRIKKETNSSANADLHFYLKKCLNKNRVYCEINGSSTNPDNIVVIMDAKVKSTWKNLIKEYFHRSGINNSTQVTILKIDNDFYLKIIKSITKNFDWFINVSSFENNVKIKKATSKSQTGIFKGRTVKDLVTGVQRISSFDFNFDREYKKNIFVGHILKSNDFKVDAFEKNDFQSIRIIVEILTNAGYSLIAISNTNLIKLKKSNVTNKDLNEFMKTEEFKKIFIDYFNKKNLVVTEKANNNPNFKSMLAAIYLFISREFLLPANHDHRKHASFIKELINGIISELPREYQEIIYKSANVLHSTGITYKYSSYYTLRNKLMTNITILSKENSFYKYFEKEIKPLIDFQKNKEFIDTVENFSFFISKIESKYPRNNIFGLVNIQSDIEKLLIHSNDLKGWYSQKTLFLLLYLTKAKIIVEDIK